MVRYTPAPGFSGSDIFSFRVVFPDGETRVKWVNVNVDGGG